MILRRVGNSAQLIRLLFLSVDRKKSVDWSKTLNPPPTYSWILSAELVVLVNSSNEKSRT